MLFVLCVLVYLYIQPTRSLISAWTRASTQRVEVRSLESANARLRAERAALQQTSTLESDARNLGLVLPGERPYVIQGLPPN